MILPARDEEATIGPIVKSIRQRLVEEAGLVHEIIVVDSRSSDATAQRAAEAGAMVYQVGPRGRDGGKGGAMQTGLARMSGDIGVYLDADVEDFDPAFVIRLLDPILRDPSLVMVKGFYDRPSPGGGGGRVTELVARPLLRRVEPRLLGFIQPLAGECAFVREPLLRLPFVSGYGVEIGMLLQVLRAHGLDALGQVDLGVRRHSHQDLDALGAHDRPARVRGVPVPRRRRAPGRRARRLPQGRVRNGGDAPRTHPHLAAAPARPLTTVNLTRRTRRIDCGSVLDQSICPSEGVRS